MGAYRFSPLLLVAVAVLATACNEQQRDTVTGPEFKTTPPPGACDFAALPGLVRNYFPGARQNYIVGLTGTMASAGQFTTGARNAGFEIMDSVGFLSRDGSVTSNAAAGASLTVGLINCMFSDASSFTYPTGVVADLTKALTMANGGAYYVRGGGRNDPGVAGANPTVLSGMAPSAGTWTSILAGNTTSEGRALVYGYLVDPTPLVYEWATVPSGVEFNPGALVAVCEEETDSKTMVHESSIGVLAYSSGNDICAQTQASAMLGGWGPRALATRLARALVDAIRPSPLQAAALTRVGSGTITTLKSKFTYKEVETVTFSFVNPPRTIFSKLQPVTIVVRATTPVDGVTTGVNGVCVYLTGTNNNGQGTSLTGTEECDNTPDLGLSAKTRSIVTADGVAAGYATFSTTVTKTGGLVLIASSTDGTGIEGVIGRSGQTFVDATVKTNVKP